MKNNLAAPVGKKKLLGLSPIERRIISLVQPFARIFKTTGGADGIHGPVTFVTLEATRFEDGVLRKLTGEKRTLLGRIFRHPEALQPYYHDLLSSERFALRYSARKIKIFILIEKLIIIAHSLTLMRNIYFVFLTLRVKEALDILRDNHSEYRFLRNCSDDVIRDTLTVNEFLTTSRSWDPENDAISRNRLLSKVQSLAEFEDLWRQLRGQGDVADSEDILLVETTND